MGYIGEKNKQKKKYKRLLICVQARPFRLLLINNKNVILKSTDTMNLPVIMYKLMTNTGSGKTASNSGCDNTKSCRYDMGDCL